MATQFGVAVRNAILQAIETTWGASAIIVGCTGAPPATPATAESGTRIAQGTLPADPLTAPSGGASAKNGTWTLTGLAAAGAGANLGYYRIYDSAGTVCMEQGTITNTVTLNTSALTAANGNVLNFASTTGVVVGLNVTGTGIPAGATVIAVTGTTVTLSHASTAGVASAAAITFRGDMYVDNINVANGQVITVNTVTKTAGNALSCRTG